METIVRVPAGPERVGVLGPAERNLKMIREGLGVRVSAREGTIQLVGDAGDVSAARATLERLAAAASGGVPMTRPQVLAAIADEAERAGAPGSLAGVVGAASERSEAAELGLGWTGPLDVLAAGRPIKAKTDNQRAYVEAIRGHDLVFGIGPAGTGKTFLAVAAAVHMLKTGRVQRVVLARPAVEAGERLGFLPGDLKDKVNPYLRPLLDALHDMVDYQTARRFMDNDVVEISPLAFMRGRTLNSSVMILDEAQNATRGQMKMFLTRMGQGSRAIVTGDTTQIDLPDPRESGLVDAARRLGRVRGVSFCQLTGEDVVRHELVQRVIEAYGREDGAAGGGAEALRSALGSALDDRADGGPDDRLDGGLDDGLDDGAGGGSGVNGASG